MCDDPVSDDLTLVKYQHPILINYKSIHSVLPRPTSGKKPPLRENSKVQWSIAAICLEVLTPMETADILNTILPPKIVQEDGLKWMQKVSSTPATKADVIQLLQLLDVRMKQRRGRETGICPVRRELYSQCFDELIRQVTIVCAERGVLLLRVRDEINMTLAAYESLYISATAYAMRKILFSELMKLELEAGLESLVHEEESLEREKGALEAELENVFSEHAALEVKDMEVRQQEMDNLKKTNLKLKKQMESMVGFKKRRQQEEAAAADP